MVRKARAAAVITTADTPITDDGKVPGDLPVIAIDRLAERPAVSGHPLTPDDLAYVLFTSGSTGEPKGALVEHRSIANTVGWYIRELDLTAADRLSWFSSPGFDASAIEVWPALRTGATLHITPPEPPLRPCRAARLADRDRHHRRLRSHPDGRAAARPALAHRRLGRPPAPGRRR